jgi:hypothetical protein
MLTGLQHRRSEKMECMMTQPLTLEVFSDYV